jgi:hypothetical protein
MSKMLLRSTIATRQIVKRQFSITRVIDPFGRQDLETRQPWKVEDFGGHRRLFHNSIVAANAAGKPTSGANEKQRNNQIVSLGKAQDWKGILDLYWKEK